MGASKAVRNGSPATLLLKESQANEIPAAPNSVQTESEAEVISSQRYHLVIPTALYQEVKQISAAEQVTMLDMFRKLIKVGLLVYKASKKPNSAVVIRDGDKHREIEIVI